MYAWHYFPVGCLLIFIGYVSAIGFYKQTKSGGQTSPYCGDI